MLSRGKSLYAPLLLCSQRVNGREIRFVRVKNHNSIFSCIHQLFWRFGVDDRRGLERNRIRRSSTPEGSPSHKYLEVAMIADDLVVKRHGEEYLDTYLMMLAHLVSETVVD